MVVVAIDLAENEMDSADAQHLVRSSHCEGLQASNGDL